MASLAGGIFRTMEIRLFFFFPGGHDTSRGIEPGKTSAQQGN